MTLQIHLLPGFSCLADMVTMRRGFLYLLFFIYESSLKNRFLDIIKDLIFSVIQLLLSLLLLFESLYGMRLILSAKY